MTAPGTTALIGAPTTSPTAPTAPPAATTWARCPPPASGCRSIVPASQVGLEGSTLRGMTFTLYGGRATWDYSARAPRHRDQHSAVQSPAPTRRRSPTSTNTTRSGDRHQHLHHQRDQRRGWVDDSSTPAAAQSQAAGGDTWNWISSNPTPFSGKLAHQSATSPPACTSTTSTGPAPPSRSTPGDSLFTYVYLDPANPPSEVMLEWNDGTWNHRAYWGANNITNGTDGTASRHYMGPLPAAGQWQPLIVPASQVDLEGSTLRGMTFTLYDGRATWDYSRHRSGQHQYQHDSTAPIHRSAITNSRPRRRCRPSVTMAMTTVNFRLTNYAQRSTNWLLGTLATSPRHRRAFSYTDSSATRQSAASAHYRAVIDTNTRRPSRYRHQYTPNRFTNWPGRSVRWTDTTLQMPKPETTPCTSCLRRCWNWCRSTPSHRSTHGDTMEFCEFEWQLSAVQPPSSRSRSNGKQVAVQSVGFKRRPLYAPLNNLRSAHRQLASICNWPAPISDNQMSWSPIRTARCGPPARSSRPRRIRCASARRSM